MIQISGTDISGIGSLRQDYLNSLPEFQELYLEMLVEDSEYFSISRDAITIGYAIKTRDNILVEFYLKDEFVPDSQIVFGRIIDSLSITKVYCKSFDHLLLVCCLSYGAAYKIIGTLFRDYLNTKEFPPDGMTIRVADHSDYDFLLQQKDGLYETPEELNKFVNGGNISMFLKDGRLVGCGYLIRVHDRWDCYDIGMWVNPDYRNLGIATQIISYLKNVCLENNWTPQCGCAVDNIASQKTLEKTGFISKHKLIEFSTD